MNFFSVVNNSPSSSLSRFFLTGARIFFAAAIVLAPFRYRLIIWSRPFFPVYSDYTDFLLFISDIAIFVTLVFWGCSLIVEPRKVDVGNRLVFVLLTGLTMAAWASTLWSVDPIASRYHSVRFVVLLVFYLFIVNQIASAWWVILPVALQALIQFPVGIGQSFAQSSLGLQSFGEHILDPLVKGMSIIPVNGERILRAYGLADHPNILGGCLAFALVVLLATTIYGKRRVPLLAASGILFIFPALLLTYSRSAWLGFFVAALFLFTGEAVARKRESVLRIGLLGVACLAVAFPLLSKDASVFGKRFNAGNVPGDGPMAERAYLMDTGNTLFVEHPISGVGIGASPLAMKLRFEEFPISYQPPHFTLLTVPLETGIFGGAFYLILFFLPFVDFIFRWRVYLQNPAGMGVLALLLAITVINLFDYYTWQYAPGRIWQWLAWGLYSQVSARKV